MMNDRILPLFALLVALGVFIAYIRPTWSDVIIPTKAAIVESDQVLVTARDYNAQQNALAAARNAIDPASLERLKNFLPDSVDNVGLILDLNALAARSRLSISNIDVTTNSFSLDSPSDQGALPAAPENPLGSIDLSLSAVGTYGALQAFLVGVEASERLLDVQDIVVKGSDTGVYTYQIKLRLFWLR